MPLTILNVAYPLAPVGPDAVGGAEQVLSLLDAALVEAGHRSLVIAQSGSVAAGTLLTTTRPEGPLTDSAKETAQRHYRAVIARALADYPVDVVHFHGVDCYNYLPPAGLPALITLHLPPGWYPTELFCLNRPRTFLHCVSAAQRRACPPCAHLLPDIPNGIPESFFPGPCAKRRFALSLGRICPEKGFHLALEAATRAGWPLLIGGEVFPYQSHERYFHRELTPRLNGQHRFLGPVGLRRKRRLLAAARCLLAPSLVPETSSLVAMAALACGTPVVAFPAGALADIVEPGKTGFLVHNQQEMAQAIVACGSIAPETCRQSARRRFSAERMLAQYLALYQRLAAEECLASEPNQPPIC